MTSQKKWRLVGDYFENCNCNIVCPCVFSAKAMAEQPTQGFCDVVMAFHIDSGNYGDVALDGLNVALAAHAPGPMAEGDWTLAVYLDERASDEQTAAIGAIFGGAEGGPMAAFAPLVGTHLGVKKAAIKYAIDGKSRSVEIPGVLAMAVDPLKGLHPSGEIWATSGHPVAPERIALAVGRDGNSYVDHGMNWNNAGRNGHYAPIEWSN
ncbi:DUF1326 domain-containing protein [Methylocystis echinoides]|jgi:hypothetical protein|uniref:DUF1326 domain-containing protein n=1 Tax=Methylocystis echinoides TaxID=29468 RepID=A0A9W6GZM1_9HYPH|nr:DUF1326 domain-containing protein [Methylocystis echinoides]GLI96043.1 hypothetical protein LMG27198_50350 [Methylocystis echinoides]